MNRKITKLGSWLLAFALLLSSMLPITASAASGVTMDLTNCHLSWDYTLTDEDGNAFTAAYGVSAEDIRSSKRSSQISNARQIAMYVIREITQMSMAAIGNEFGGRDHSTVVYATGQVVKNMKQDTKYKETVEDIIKNIRDA